MGIIIKWIELDNIQFFDKKSSQYLLLPEIIGEKAFNSLLTDASIVLNIEELKEVSNDLPKLILRLLDKANHHELLPHWKRNIVFLDQNYVINSRGERGRKALFALKFYHRIKDQIERNISLEIVEGNHSELAILKKR